MPFAARIEPGTRVRLKDLDPGDSGRSGRGSGAHGYRGMT